MINRVEIMFKKKETKTIKKYSDIENLQNLSENFGKSLYKETKANIDGKKWDVIFLFAEKRCSELPSHEIKTCKKIINKMYSEKTLLNTYNKKNEENENYKYAIILNMELFNLNLHPNDYIRDFAIMKCKEEKKKNKIFLEDYCILGVKNAFDSDPETPLLKRLDAPSLFIGTKIIDL